MSLSSTLEKPFESECVESISYHSSGQKELTHFPERPVYCQEILYTLRESGWVLVAIWYLKQNLLCRTGQHF